MSIDTADNGPSLLGLYTDVCKMREKGKEANSKVNQAHRKKKKQRKESVRYVIYTREINKIKTTRRRA